MIEITEEHFVGKIAQKAIITNKDTVLITRDHLDEHTWELPGGRLNIDEEPKNGLSRELFEELGVDVVVGDIVYVEQFFHERAQERHLLITYHATLADPTQVFTLSPEEVAEIAWVTKEELPRYHIFANCQRALESFFEKTN